MYEKLIALFLQLMSNEEKNLNEYEKENEYISLIKELSNYIKQDIDLDKLRDMVVGINEDAINNIIVIKKLREYANKINSDIINLDIKELENFLSIISHINILKKEDLRNLETVKKLDGLVMLPNFSDPKFKEKIIDLKKELIDKMNVETNKLINKTIADLEKFCNNIIVKKIGKIGFKKRKTEENICQIKKYFDIFDESGIKKPFSTSSDMEKFYKMVLESTLSDDDKFAIILDVSKYNVDFFNNLLDIKASALTNKIEENVESVTETMKKLVPPTNITESEVDKTELSVVYALNPEEKKIIEQVNQLIDCCQTVTIDEDFLELFRNDFSTRGSIYFKGNVLDWNLIFTDVKYVLLPNLNTRKDEVIERFKDILKVNDEVEKRKIEIQNKVDFLEEVSAKIQGIKISRSAEINYFKFLNQTHRQYYKDIYYYIKSGDLSSARGYAQTLDIPLEFFEYFGLLDELIGLQDTIKDKIKSKLVGDEDEYNKLISKSQKLLDREQQIRNAFEKYLNVLNTFQQDSSPNDYHNCKNIIYIFRDDLSSYDDAQKSELQECVSKLLNTKWNDLRDRKHFVEQLYRIKRNGERDYYEKEDFDALRLWGRGGTRTGLIRISICNENQEKISKKFGLESIGSILIITDVIHSSGQNHNEYHILREFIEDNREFIEKMVKLFSEPAANEEELFEIVDKALEKSTKVEKGNFGSIQKY